MWKSKQLRADGGVELFVFQSHVSADVETVKCLRFLSSEDVGARCNVFHSSAVDPLMSPHQRKCSKWLQHTERSNQDFCQQFVYCPLWLNLEQQPVGATAQGSDTET